MDDDHIFEYFDHLESLSAGARLTFQSSGSTGEAKVVSKDWAAFKKDFPAGPALGGLVWATCFDPRSYAGMAVAVQAWLGRGEFIRLESDRIPRCWDQIEKHRVTALSLTPTFLKLLAYLKPGNIQPAAFPIRRVTLGGECVGVDAVNLCRTWWPESQVRVIYASAELGPIFIARDFQGFYTSADLHPQWSGLDIRGGELYLRKSAAESQQDWMATGDLAEAGGPGQNQVRILGRVARVVNVGGFKFSLDAIESCLEACPGVEIALCQAVANPVTGQIVECQWHGSAGEKDLQNWAQSHLPKPAWPRLWTHSPNLTLKNGKKGFKV